MHQRGKLRLAFLAVAFSGMIQAAEVKEPVLDGMLIKCKANTLQRVKIRVKSFGPGFCKVDVDFADKRDTFSAPPLKWSEWFPIGPAISGGAHKLGFSPDCDTGALGEVKYDKEKK